MTLEELKKYIDEMCDADKAGWMGVPLEDMTKEQLIKALRAEQQESANLRNRIAGMTVSPHYFNPLNPPRFYCDESGVLRLNPTCEV